jgi:hypothetical protein
MRSTTPSPRPVTPSERERLEALARVVDEACVDERRHVVVHLTTGPDDLELAIRPLPHGAHPFNEIAGLVAPPDWAGFGVRALGTARFLDDAARPPQRTATTLIVDRRGQEVSLLRTSDGVQLLPEPGSGTIPDACRRVLDLPTAAPPPSTAVLWTLAWLDRLLEAWAQPSERRRLTSSWAEVARRHPAITHGRGDPPADLEDPATLVPIARSHAAAWPWHRLREEPGALRLPGSDLPPEVTRWMDDGFYARWALAAYPALGTLATDLPSLLGDPLGTQLIATAVELLEHPADDTARNHRRGRRHGS